MFFLVPLVQFWVHFGSFLWQVDPFRGPLGSLGASRGPFGFLWVVLGAPWGPLGGSWALLGGFGRSKVGVGGLGGVLKERARPPEGSREPREAEKRDFGAVVVFLETLQTLRI